MFYDGAHLDVFFRRFGQDVTYTVAVDGELGSTGISIKAIVDEPGTMQLVGGVPVQVVKRKCTVKTSDVSAPTTSDTVTIGTTVYTVVGFNPDGTGMTVLTLATDSR